MRSREFVGKDYGALSSYHRSGFGGKEEKSIHSVRAPEWILISKSTGSSKTRLKENV
jgi:hypothetical protein